MSHMFIRPAACIKMKQAVPFAIIISNYLRGVLNDPD